MDTSWPDAVMRLLWQARHESEVTNIWGKGLGLPAGWAAAQRGNARIVSTVMNQVTSNLQWGCRF
jgi:hypothetical protein